MNGEEGMNREAEPLWTSRDVARYLGMSLSWVRQRVAAGTIPCLHVGGWAVRFEPEVIREWARSPGGAVMPIRRGSP